jgi:hypothetical protein
VLQVGFLDWNAPHDSERCARLTVSVCPSGRRGDRPVRDIFPGDHLPMATLECVGGV